MHTLNREDFFIKLEAAQLNDGLLQNVSVITIGEIKGHDCYADAVTLESIKTAAEAAGRVKCKLGHWTGAEAIVGALNNFQIQGERLLADLQLFKTHPMYNNLIEIAKTIPATFGLSVSVGCTKEEIEKQLFIRVTQLYSIDLVDEPAANPGGLFSTTGAAPLTREQLEAIIGVASAIVPGGFKPDWSYQEIFCEAERMCYQAHLKLPGSRSEMALSSEYWRPGAERVTGMARCLRSSAQDRINQIANKTNR